ncbi:hypothetical protein [Niveispirillum sp. KHB5.9]|uniref:hypothetical protein n=1 Tax=Niveispirillum sp. KHB5.9 TaxID=3400269 RepID=UPI003A88559B
MTQTPATLPEAPADTGTDYMALRAEMVRLTQRLSGRVWTNYNFSDPGVTIIEQLCFALTELSYRARFPVSTLLARPGEHQVDCRRQALYRAPVVMPVNPVTPADLRRILLDRVRGLGNVWVDPIDFRAPDAAGIVVGGLYAVRLWLVPEDDCACPDHSRFIRTAARVEDVYAAHRALGEDIGDLRLLLPLRSTVGARVTLTDCADPEDVMAGLLFALEQNLAPTPARRSLWQELAAGRTTADILEGPRMLRGFIDDAALGPRPESVRVVDLLRVMERVPGVELVQELAVRIPETASPAGVDDTITLPPDTLPALVTGTVGGGWPLRLWQRGLPCTIDEREVQRRLARLRRAHGRTFDLPAEYRRHFGPPPAQPRALAAYGSVQNQFPSVYGIGEEGPPTGIGTTREAQIRQLKGYLMVFDQMMADYFAQLAFLRDLYSLNTGGDRTYVWRSLRTIVPDAAPILRAGYDEGMAVLVRAGDPVRRRQADILAFLLSVYGETLDPAGNGACGASPLREPSPWLVSGRRRLLRRLVGATADRGRGIDWRGHRGSGMEIRAGIQLDLLDAGIDTGSSGAAGAPRIDRQPPARLDEKMAALVAERFITLETVLTEAGSLEDADGFTEPGLPPLPPSLLPALGDPSRYRVGLHPQSGGVLLVCRGDDGTWWHLGEYSGPGPALAAARRWLCTGVYQAEKLYIVEYVLLRYARELTDRPADDYTFRIAAIMRADARQLANPGWRAEAERIIRANTPTHIEVQCHFLAHAAMGRFRRLYREWRHGLRHGGRRRAVTSARLQRFLEDPAAGRRPERDGDRDGE